MQTRDANQVANTRVPKQIPVSLANAALVADGQGNDDGTVTLAPKFVVEMGADLLARALDGVGGRVDHRAQTLRRRLLSDVSRGAYVLLQQPALEIKTMGIRIAVGTFQTCRQSPAFSRMHG